MTSTMRAAQRREYGRPESVVSVADAPVPEVADDEVLVQVHAAGVDRGALHLVEGTPYALRLVFGIRRPKQPGIGLDLAGRVVAVGAAATRFSVGDEVCGIGRAAFAQFAAAPQHKLIAKPAGLSFVEAAALPVSGVTALQAVQDVASVAPGERVLVLGASGGVGSYTVQLAAAAGATVGATCSPAKSQAVQDLGADEVYPHGFDALPHGVFDVVLAIGGNLSVRQLCALATPRGRVVVVGGEGGGQLLGVGRQLRAVARNVVVRQRLSMLVASESGEDLQRLADLVVAGAVRPLVGAQYPLDGAAAALADLAAGRVTGKSVLVVR